MQLSKAPRCWAPNTVGAPKEGAPHRDAPISLPLAAPVFARCGRRAAPPYTPSEPPVCARRRGGQCSQWLESVWQTTWCTSARPPASTVTTSSAAQHHQTGARPSRRQGDTWPGNQWCVRRHLLVPAPWSRCLPLVATPGGTGLHFPRAGPYPSRQCPARAGRRAVKYRWWPNPESDEAISLYGARHAIGANGTQQAAQR